MQNDKIIEENGEKKCQTALTFQTCDLDYFIKITTKIKKTTKPNP